MKVTQNLLVDRENYVLFPSECMGGLVFPGTQELVAKLK